MTNFDWHLDRVGMRHLDDVFFAHLMMINVAVFDWLADADLFVVNLLADELLVNFTHFFGLFVALNFFLLNVPDFFYFFVGNLTFFVM